MRGNYPDCDLCDGPVDGRDNYLTYNGTYLCSTCLRDAVDDDGGLVDECAQCANLWHTDFLRPHRDPPPGYGDEDFACPECRRSDYSAEIREAVAKALQVEVDHAVEVVKRSIRALHKTS